MSEILIEIRRGPIAENLIRGNAAIVGVDGQLLYRIGDPDYFTYMRSTAKPLQASAAVECLTPKIPPRPSVTISST